MDKYNKLINYLVLLIIIVCLLNITGCQNKDDTNTLSQKEQELKLKEKELQVKEREMLDKKEAELNAKEKEIQKSTSSGQNENKKSGINLEGSYSGSIKDGTRWFVSIKKFDGINFSGYNEVYWEKTPQGYKTNFSGTYDASTKEIIMNEDKKAKGSGKFIGKVSVDGKNLSGDWFRYTDGNSFTWNLEKLLGE